MPRAVQSIDTGGGEGVNNGWRSGWIIFEAGLLMSSVERVLEGDSGGGGLHRYATEMTADSSKEGNSFNVWQRWCDWHREVVAESDRFNWKSEGGKREEKER